MQKQTLEDYIRAYKTLDFSLSAKTYLTSGNNSEEIYLEHIRLGDTPDMRGREIRGYILLNYENVDFSGAVLYGCFPGGIGRGAIEICPAKSIRSIGLPYTNLTGQRWTDEDFSELNLTHSNISGSSFTRVNLANANLKQSNARYISLNNVNLEGANLEGSDLEQATLKGTILRRANLKGANLSRFEYTDLNAAGADFSNANFDACQFFEDGGDFSNANFQSANFTDSRIASGKFTHSSFQGANFKYCVITGDLDFRNANFQSANFKGAGLMGGDFSGASFEGAVYDQHTSFPSSMTHLKQLMTLVESDEDDE